MRHKKIQRTSHYFFVQHYAKLLVSKHCAQKHAPSTEILAKKQDFQLSTLMFTTNHGNRTLVLFLKDEVKITLRLRLSFSDNPIFGPLDSKNLVKPLKSDNYHQMIKLSGFGNCSLCHESVCKKT
jgi:hypothetical protein